MEKIVNITIPPKLKKGDTVALVSLSSGMAGDSLFYHKYELGKKRLEDVFGLNVITMPNALKGSDFLYNHPELRAKDLMDAFANKEVKAIFTMIGGDDSLRLLPFIDYNVIKNNPKIFMGYSDTTVSNLIMYKANLMSYYGPALLSEFAENGAMHDYTKNYIFDTLFKTGKVIIESSNQWTNDRIDWTDASKDNDFRRMSNEEHGFEILQGGGSFSGELIGGCMEVLNMIIGTDIWPLIDKWENKVLFLETSEGKPSPDEVAYFLRHLSALGIINKLNGIIIGKPKGETYYEEYKSIIKKVISIECNKKDLPILYNVNFGHSAPMCILPFGSLVTVDLEKKQIVLETH